MTKSILVIADEDDNLAIEKAHSLATALEAELEVVLFLSKLDIESDSQRELVIEKAKQTLVDDIAKICGEERQVECNVIATDNVVDWMVNACQQKTYEFVVKTGHQTENDAQDPLDTLLMRKIPCPLFLASNRKWKSKQVIVASVDLSTDDKLKKDYNNIVLQWTTMLSEVLHYEVHIIYSIPIARPLLEFDVVEKIEVQKKKQPAAEKHLESLTTTFNLGHAETHITVGPPEKNIPSLANKLKADLVIMGCVGQKGLKSFLFGKTSEKTLHYIRTDILICRGRRAKQRK